MGLTSGSIADRGPIPHVMGLKAQAVSGMLVMGGSRLATKLLDQVFTIALVRLLAPRDFGLMAMAGVFTALFSIFADMGLSRAVVQRAEMDEEYLSTAFWANVAAGIILCMVTFGVAEIVARAYSQPLVRAILGILGLRFIVAGLSVTQDAIQSRHMKYGLLMGRDVVSVVAGGIVGVALALAGAGVWSLVGQAMGMSASSAAFLWLTTGWRPHRLFSWQKFQHLWAFGSRLLAARFFSFAVKQGDNLLIGRALGPVLLGYYAFGYGLFLAPLVDISLVVGRVAFSAFARLQDNLPLLRRGFIMTTRYVAVFAFPALLGLMLVSSDLILVVFGAKWLPAVPVLRVLLVAGILQSYGNLWSAAFQAMGRTDVLLKWSIGSAALYLPAFAIGLRWGIVGVAAGYTASTVILIPVQLVLLERLLGLRLRRYLSTLAPVGLATAIMGACVMLAQHWLGHAGSAAAVRLAVSVAVGCATYTVAIVFVQRDLITGLARLLGELRYHPRPRMAGKMA